MEFSLAEKLGILKAIDQVIRVDGNIYEGEAVFISQLSSVVKFDSQIYQQAREIELDQAMGILKSMPDAKKHVLASILNEAANADGRVGEDELRMIYKIFSNIGIDVDQI